MVLDELSSMEKKGNIQKVEEPTPWVNSMVVNEKESGKLRICIDPRDLNKVIEREPYELPTQQEITSRLAGARYFSKLDATSGYWQSPLDEDRSGTPERGGMRGAAPLLPFARRGRGAIVPFLEKTTIVNTFFSLKEEGCLCTLKSMTATY